MIRSYVTWLGFLIWYVLAGAGKIVWTFLRPGLRFISALLVVAAVIALVTDLTRWQTMEGGPVFQSLANHIRSAAPATLDGIGKSVSNMLHPLVWDPVLIAVLALPAWLFLILLGLLIGYATRERRQVNIFIN